MVRVEEVVKTVDALIAATKNEGVKAIILGAELNVVPAIALSSEQSLWRESEPTHLSFAAGSDGLDLSSDNRVLDVTLSTVPKTRAIQNDLSVAHLAQIELRN